MKILGFMHSFLIFLALFSFQACREEKKSLIKKVAQVEAEGHPEEDQSEADQHTQNGDNASPDKDDYEPDNQGQAEEAIADLKASEDDSLADGKTPKNPEDLSENGEAKEDQEDQQIDTNQIAEAQSDENKQTLDMAEKFLTFSKSDPRNENLVKVYPCAIPDSARIGESNRCIAKFSQYVQLVRNLYKKNEDYIKNKAYDEIRPILSQIDVFQENQENKKNIIQLSRNYFKTILSNFLNSNSDKLGLTGFDLSFKDYDTLLKYMAFSRIVYTDSFSQKSAADKLPAQFLKKLRAMLRNYLELNSSKQRITSLLANYEDILKDNKFDKETNNAPGGQVISIESSLKKKFAALESQYESLRKNVESLLKIQLDAGLANMDASLAKIEQKYQGVENLYELYFKSLREKDKKWWDFLGSNERYHINYRGKKYQLSPAGHVMASFVSAMQNDLENFGDFLDEDHEFEFIAVGFRHHDSIFSDYKQALGAKILWPFKANKNAMFKDGEVNFVAVLIPGQEKDELVITFSGSNSHYDWTKDLDTRLATYFDLDLHRGIAEVANEHIRWYDNKIKNNLKSYYKNSSRYPSQLQITLTGHSLGGGLASILAYKYKREAENLRKFLGLQSVKVKAYTYAAPAVMTPKSVDVMNTLFGLENLKNIWVAKDIVTANYLGRRHPGLSIPLLDFEDTAKSFGDFFAPHLYERYLKFLKENRDTSDRLKTLILELNKYVAESGLLFYKNSKKELNQLEAFVKQNTPSKFELVLPDAVTSDKSISISEKMANDILYMSRKIDYDLPLTVRKWEPNSINSAEIGEPLFLPPHKGKVRLTVLDIVSGFPIEYEVTQKTSCEPEIFRKIGLQDGTDIISDTVCGCCIAKSLFTAGYRNKYRFWQGRTTTTINQTLEMCLNKVYCSYHQIYPEEVQENTKAKIIRLLEKVELADEFLNREIYGFTLSDINKIIKKHVKNSDKRLSVEDIRILLSEREQFKSFIARNKYKRDFYSAVCKSIRQNKDSFSQIYRILAFSELLNVLYNNKMMSQKYIDRFFANIIYVASLDWKNKGFVGRLFSSIKSTESNTLISPDELSDILAKFANNVIKKE